MKNIICLLLIISSHFYVAAQPPNDNPCGAINLTVENTGCEPTTVFSWVGATANNSYGNTYCNGPDKQDVWYKFTVPANGEFKANIDYASTANMCAEFYTSTSCNVGGLTVFNQNTNGFPCMYTNSTSGGDGNFKNLTPGSVVYIRVFPLYYNNIPDANIKLCVASTNTLADEPCNAGFLPIEAPDPVGQACTPYKAYTWAAATLTAGIPNPNCIGSMNPSNIRDVWYKVRVPASGKIVINAAGNDSYVYCTQAFTAAACNSSFTQIGCSLSQPLNFTLAPNSIIYVRVFPWTGGVAPNGSAKICVAGRNDVPAINNSNKVGIGIDTPFAKLDVVGTGIIRDKLTAGSDVEVRGNLIVQGNIVGKYGTAVLQGNTTIQGGPLKIDSLDLGNRTGNRIALFGGMGNSGKYGFGIQNALLQMYSDAAFSDVAFGYGNSFNFTERARIINQGEMGMKIKGRLQLLTGTNSAGLWLSNNANTTNAAFMGLASDNQIGFFGNNGVGWGLTMNTLNANVGIGLNGAQPAKPLSFPATLGEKILLYPGGVGEVGIGVYGNELRLHADNPGAKVSFGTQDNAGVYSENALAQRNGAYAFSILGSLWVNGTTYASDERFKQNITPIASPLQKLLQLNGVEYEMKTNEFSKLHFQPGRQMGLLAQNVEKVIPEAVNEKDGYKGVDYARLVPLLIEAIKELQKEVELLKLRQ